MRGCFVRVEPWLQAGKYVAAVASGLARRNGWTIAEQAGDLSPQRMQRLLKPRRLKQTVKRGKPKNKPSLCAKNCAHS